MKTVIVTSTRGAPANTKDRSVAECLGLMFNGVTQTNWVSVTQTPGTAITRNIPKRDQAEGVHQEVADSKKPVDGGHSHPLAHGSTESSRELGEEKMEILAS